ncbi:hypothetical protein Ade02nite_10550 [Paractinoplanes deccanensis]|uniref:Uncharacterized protein n=1 Tax=Paractinoplanes deccanensis TaxID=113561 RepID=A0ABQ3XXD7_9ACTN|nr:hypothetical protein Ade02nite_10550 [Actinoplanes deccanensis]
MHQHSERECGQGRKAAKTTLQPHRSRHRNPRTKQVTKTDAATAPKQPASTDTATPPKQAAKKRNRT